ncbi:MAG: hypothetical protein A2505_02930 [Deltaproteobacteria bacterium RIFOXYD12_FULL_55_16]|nr:MAG: hypothetical protein A2505_02930 [Deltaproteobacteria bacterium RIFOXYD12_FULL_55_16]
MSDKKNTLPPSSASPRVWAFTTYFCEGLPYSIIRSVSAVFFRDNGVSLEGIGLTSLFGLPWALKFFWAPHIDHYGSKRQWLLIMQIMLAMILLLTAAIAPLPQAAPLAGLLFFVASFLAATHDIAIDGYYLETLDTAQQARFVGYRVMAYRIAMMAGTGIIATIGATVSWSAAFAGAAMILALFSLYHRRYLPHSEETRLPLTSLLPRPKTGHLLWLALMTALLIIALRISSQMPAMEYLRQHLVSLPRIEPAPLLSLLLTGALVMVGCKRKSLEKWLRRRSNAFFSEAFFSFMAREKIGTILAFILLIRTGEYMLSSMAAPFMVDLGLKQHYGWISGGVGLPFSIIGAMAGGWLISKYSLKKMIWPLLLAQNLTNLTYMLLAFKLAGFITINTGNPNPSAIGGGNLFAVVCVHAFDQFAGGLGTAVLMIFLMRLCKPRFKAAHYAIGTGLMSFSGLYAGVLSGFLAAWAGYGYFFLLSFMLSLPGMALAFFIPLADRTANPMIAEKNMEPGRSNSQD